MRKWTLSEFAEILEKEGLLVRAEGEAEIVRISYDSRTVTEGTLFVCKGLNFKEEYLAGAEEKGAAAYVAEKEYGADLPRLIVSDVRKGLGNLLSCGRDALMEVPELAHRTDGDVKEPV